MYKVSFCRVITLTIFLQCGVNFLTFHSEGPRDVMTFSGLLLIEHQY
jgi:hypothetical protein